MNLRDYIAERERRDPEFREAREASQALYDFRHSLIGARLRAGLTQKDLAERMETTQSAISRLEAGEHIPTVDTLCRLSAILGIEFSITPHEGLKARVPAT